MTESLIAPSPNTQGAPDDVAPPSSRNEGSDQQATSDSAPSSVAAAALLYRGPDAEAAQAEPDAPPAEEQAPVAYEPFQLPQGVDVDTAALEEAQSLFAEARLSQPQAQKLVDLYAGKMNELVQRQISAAQDRQKAWVAEVRSDPELGGRRLNRPAPRPRRRSTVSACPSSGERWTSSGSATTRSSSASFSASHLGMRSTTMRPPARQ